MKRFLFCILALWPGWAWGQDWGGSSYQDPDSIDFAALVSTLSYDDSNFGTSTTCNFQDAIRWGIIRIKNDPHTAGYTQDSAWLYMYFSSGVSGDTMMLYGRVCKRPWAEGIHNGTPPSAGEVTWLSSQYGTQTWTTPGAAGSGTDVNATIVCSLLIDGSWSAGQKCSTKIAGTYLTDEFFDYGIVLSWGWDDAAAPTFGLYSDNWVLNADRRPYFSGWETEPATSALVIGGGTVVGGNVVIGGK